VNEALGTWIDGVVGGHVPADDRGLQYGDGVFETILVRNGVPRFLESHLERLRRGLTQLRIPFSDEAALRSEIGRAAAMAPPLAIVKLIVTRGSSQQRGYAPRGALDARRIVSLWRTAALDPELEQQGVVLEVARLRVPTPSPFAGLKHLNRLENVLASSDTLDGLAFEVLMLDADGNVVSGASSNFFLVKAGRISTPPMDRAGVAGVMRSVVLREALRLGIEACERTLTLQDVIAADGSFITNARIGVVPVRRLREHVFTMTDVARELQRHIESLDA
jgi:4-amino-4-deoxychorismate lyase